MRSLVLLIPLVGCIDFDPTPGPLDVVYAELAVTRDAEGEVTVELMGFESDGDCLDLGPEARVELDGVALSDFRTDPRACTFLFWGPVDLRDDPAPTALTLVDDNREHRLTVPHLLTRPELSFEQTETGGVYRYEPPVVSGSVELVATRFRLMNRPLGDLPLDRIQVRDMDVVLDFDTPCADTTWTADGGYVDILSGDGGPLLRHASTQGPFQVTADLLLPRIPVLLEGPEDPLCELTSFWGLTDLTPGTPLYQESLLVMSETIDGGFYARFDAFDHKGAFITAEAPGPVGTRFELSATYREDRAGLPFLEAGAMETLGYDPNAIENGWRPTDASAIGPALTGTLVGLSDLQVDAVDAAGFTADGVAVRALLTDLPDVQPGDVLTSVRGVVHFDGVETVLVPRGPYDL